MTTDEDWIEIHPGDPKEISWDAIRRGLAVMGIHNPDDIVEFRIAGGRVTLSRIRRATRTEPAMRIIKVAHQ